MLAARRKNARAFAGMLFLVAGFVWLTSLYTPQAAILTVVTSDPGMALYFLAEHVGTDVCFILAAFSLMSTLGEEESTWRELGLSRFPLIAPLFVLILLPVVLISQALWQIALAGAFHVALPPMDTAFAYWLVHDRLTFLAQVFDYCLVAPFAEELLFRGFLSQWLIRRSSVALGAIGSAACFATLHFNLLAFGSTFVFGVVSALMLRYTRSLWPSILLHISINVFFVLVSLGVLH